jgi:RHS repeat-associated protein
VLTQGYWSQAYAGLALSRNYIYGNTIDEVLGFEWVVDGTPGMRYYYLHDHLYSPAAMLTEWGVAERYEYDAYGRRSVMTAGFAPCANSHYLSDLGLTGREIDELDLDAAATPRLQHMHYRHRDYSPDLGRFLQQDPLMYVDGTNLYEYCGSNSIIRVDPMGLKYDPTNPMDVALCMNQCAASDLGVLEKQACRTNCTAPITERIIVPTSYKALWENIEQRAVSYAKANLKPTQFQIKSTFLEVPLPEITVNNIICECAKLTRLNKN